MIEIVDHGRITQRYTVAFSGQAKTRGADGTRAGETYGIPVLAPASEVVSAFVGLRGSVEGREWQGMEPRLLNGSLNSSLNKVLRDRSEIASRWPETEDLTLKMLRPFYAEVAHEMFCPAQMTRNAFFARVLGHADDDFTTGHSYMRFALSAKGRRAVLAEMDRVMAAHTAQQMRRQSGDEGAQDDVEVIDD